jgi:hypothetical protein
MSFEPESGVGVVVLTNGDGVASEATDLVATYIYDRLLGCEDLEARYAERLAELQREKTEREASHAEHLAERAARLRPLSHTLQEFAGSYESPRLGRIVWQVVAEGLEARIGVAGSRAEVYDAAKDQLRLDIAGGIVVTFEFPESGGAARSLVIVGDRFERIADADLSAAR